MAAIEEHDGLYAKECNELSTAAEEHTSLSATAKEHTSLSATEEHTSLLAAAEEHTDISREALLSGNRIDITNYDIRMQLIRSLSKISGNIPEIIRFYDCLKIIQDRIAHIGLKTNTYTDMKKELEDLRDTFKFNIDTLVEIITCKDHKRYKAFFVKHKKRLSKVNLLQSSIERLLRILNLDNVRLNQRQKPNQNNDYYITNLRKINILICELKLKHTNLEYVISTNRSSKNIDCAELCKISNSEKKNYLSAANVFGLSQTEFGDYLEERAIFLHESRRYKCIVPIASLKLFIDTCLKNAFPKILPSTNPYIELFAQCPCNRIKGAPCTKLINLDTLIQVHNLPEYKRILTIAKCVYIEEKYNVNPFINCPKPDCPNGDGFANTALLPNILEGKPPTEKLPIHKCPLCKTVWCSLCGKSHLGKTCPDPDDIHLDPESKRCPKCKAGLYKIDGCFHMECPSCACHFCWTCNQLITEANPYLHRCVTGNSL